MSTNDRVYSPYIAEYARVVEINGDNALVQYYNDAAQYWVPVARLELVESAL